AVQKKSVELSWGDAISYTTPSYVLPGSDGQVARRQSRQLKGTDIVFCVRVRILVNKPLSAQHRRLAFHALHPKMELCISSLYRGVGSVKNWSAAEGSLFLIAGKARRRVVVQQPAYRGFEDVLEVDQSLKLSER
ncbi:hypothetical protein FOZ63_006871, partial [Perkinsus olseni]